MRQIATLADSTQAQKLADFLLTLNIDTHIQQDAQGWEVWVRDEDQLPRAREELEQFTRNPDDARYTEVGRLARNRRREEFQLEQDYNRRQQQLDEQMRHQGQAWVNNEPPTWMPVTTFLIALSVLVAITTNLGSNKLSFVFQNVAITPFEVTGEHIRWPGLLAVRQGEVWRLVTPIFLHFGIIHLAFNMFVLYRLGRLVEWRCGSWLMIILVLLTAVPSNLGEYYLQWSWTKQFLPVESVHPLFGGMSGVLYGLFGFVWVTSRWEPRLRLEIGNDTIVMLLIWFFLCLSGVMGSIANIAHGVGLAMGVVLGVVVCLLYRLFLWVTGK